MIAAAPGTVASTVSIVVAMVIVGLRNPFL
jgi:hypothetical protein